MRILANYKFRCNQLKRSTEISYVQWDEFYVQLDFNVQLDNFPTFIYGSQALKNNVHRHVSTVMPTTSVKIQIPTFDTKFRPSQRSEWIYLLGR